MYKKKSYNCLPKLRFNAVYYVTINLTIVIENITKIFSFSMTVEEHMEFYGGVKGKLSSDELKREIYKYVMGCLSSNFRFFTVQSYLLVFYLNISLYIYISPSLSAFPFNLRGFSTPFLSHF